MDIDGQVIPHLWVCYCKARLANCLSGYSHFYRVTLVLYTKYVIHFCFVDA